MTEKQIKKDGPAYKRREAELLARRQARAKKNTRATPKKQAEKVCIYIADRAGWVPQPWQEEFFSKALAKEIGIAALSMGRGGGKTAMVAGLVASCIDFEGPLYRGKDSICYVQGPTLNDTGPLMVDIQRIIGAEKSRTGRYDAKGWKILNSNSNKSVEHVDGGMAIAQGWRPKLGKRFALYISDESCFYLDGGAKTWGAIKSGLGKFENDLAVAISTRSPNKNHWFERLLYEPGQGRYSKAFACTDDDPLGTWERANPNIHIGVPHRERLEDALANALVDTREMADFLCYNANAGVAGNFIDLDLLATSDEWNALAKTNNIAPDYPPEIIGLDLGAAISLSCVVGIWDTGQIVCHSFMGNHPELSILQREANDMVPGLYTASKERGELTVFNGMRVVGEREIARWLAQHWGKPRKLVSDYFSKSAVEDAFDDINWGDVLEFHNRFEKHDSISRFRDAVLLKYLPKPDSLILDAAISRAVITKSNEGWWRQQKPPGRGPRDDMASAYLHCFGWWNRQEGKEMVEEEEMEVYVGRPM